jgi:hypothetical protein
VALACAAACYAVAFVRLEQEPSRSRNFYTYSTFGFLLALTGSRILLSAPAAAWLWAVLAAAGVWSGAQFGRLTLIVHGCLLLALALIASGALRQAGAYLLGAGLPPRMETPLWGGAAAAGVCCWLALRRAAPHGGGIAQMCRLAASAAFLWLLAGMAAYAAAAGYHAIFGPGASHAYCATLRTSVLVGGALASAWAGARWSHRELASLVYPLMAVGGYRLLAQDLRQDRSAALFLSLLIYGAALTALPRLRRGPAA